jgi:hypothetical protein
VNWLKRFMPSPYSDIESRGSSLPELASTAAIGGSTSMLKSFPALSGVSSEQLDFLLTVGVVCSAIIALRATQYDSRQQNAGIAAVRRAMDSWNPHGNAALDDCAAYVERTMETLMRLSEYEAESRLALWDALGAWTVTNLLGHHSATTEERDPVRPMGRWCVWALKDYWT